MKTKSLEERQQAFQKLMSDFPGKIPIIIDRHPDFPNLQNIEKHKFLIDKNMSLSSFKNFFAEKYFKSSNSIICIKFYVINIEITEEMSLSELYEKYKEEDGFLYLKYSYDNTQILDENDSKNEIKNKYEEKARLIIEKDPHYPYIKNMIRNKFIMPINSTFSALALILRKKYLDLEETIDNVRALNVVFRVQSNYRMISEDDTICDIYNDYKDHEGLLYLYYYYEYTIEKKYKQKPLEVRKQQCQTLRTKFPDKVPFFLEKNPNSFINKQISKQRFIMAKNKTVSEMIDLLIPIIGEEPPENTQLNILLSESQNHLSLYKNATFEEIYNVYQEEDGFMYLQYSYEFTQRNNLEKRQPKYKVDNTLEERKKHAEKVMLANKLPIIVERYPDSKLKYMSKQYELSYNLTLNKLLDLIYKDLMLKDKDKDDKFTFCLLNSDNIDLRTQEKATMCQLFKKYIDEDGHLYFYYIELSLLDELKIKNYNEIFNFKKLYSLEERKEKYEELNKKNPNKLKIRVQKEFDLYDMNNKNDDIDELYMYGSKIQIDTLKMKIWEKLGKPFLNIILMNYDGKIDNFSQIGDLVHYQDDDSFIYLFYKCVPPSLDNDEKNNKDINANMSDNLKILYLFRRIPFKFQPSPSFNNCNTKTKVYLPYETKKSTFKSLKTDPKYKYYLDYPKIKVDSNEIMFDYYMKNKNKEDDFLYLIIAEEKDE